VTAALPAQPPDSGVTVDRWSYGEGHSAGRLDGVRAGFADGYAAGFDVGVDVGAARILLAVEHSLGGRLPELLPRLPHTGHYRAYRHRTQPSNQPCPEACGSCSRCLRAAAARANLSRHGTPDYPGATARASSRSRP
jgi:hypothetical protein